MAEKRTIELEIQDNSKSLKQQYREAVQELQAVSAQYGETSKEAAKAAQKAAELKDQIAFSKDLVNTFNPDAKFKAVEGAISGALNGFQAFEGALGIIGVESEKLQETMVRLQSVMAFTQGINGVLEAGDSFRQLGVKATDAFSKMSTAGKVFAISGIGLLITAVGALVANFDKVTAALSSQTAAQKVSNQVTKEAISSIAGELSAADKLSRQLKDETLTREQKLQKVKEFQAAYPGLLKNINLETMSIDQINGQLEKNIQLLKLQAKAKAIQSIREEEYKKVLIAQTNSVEDNLGAMHQMGKAVSDFFGLEEYNSKGYEALAHRNKKIATDEANTRINALDAIDKSLTLEMEKLKQEGAQVGDNNSGIQDYSKSVAGFTTATNNNTAAIEKRNEALRNTADLEKQLVDEQIKAIANENQRTQTQLIVETERRIKEIQATNASEKSKANLIKQIQENLILELDKLDKEYYDKQQKDQEDREKTDKEQRLNALKSVVTDLIETKKTEAEIEMAAWMEKRKKQKERDAEEIAARRKKEELILMSTKNSLQIASDLTQLFAGKSDKQQKKAFMIQKGINIANATVDTYGAATKALREYPSPFNYIAMAAAITAGLLNIKKIQQTQFNASGSGGGGSNVSANAPEAMTANFSTIGSSGINQLAQLQQKPTQAYVVSGEVTSAQALDRNRVQNATL